MLHQQPAEAVALELRAQQDREFAVLVAGVVVQAHHAEQLAARLLDGDEGHGMGGIVVDELVDQLVADFAHGREEAQPQVFAGHFLEKIRIERGILDLERPDQHLRPIAQRDVAFVQGLPLPVVPAKAGTS